MAHLSRYFLTLATSKYKTQYSRLHQWRRSIRPGPPPGRQILPPCFVWKERKPLSDGELRWENKRRFPPAVSWRCPGMQMIRDVTKLRPSPSSSCSLHACSGTSRKSHATTGCRMLSQKLSRITLKMSDFEEYEQLKKTREKEMDTSQNGGQSKSPHGSTLKIKSSVRASTPEHQLQPSD